MSDEAAIEETLRTYLDGLYEGDGDKLARAFHPTSALTWEQDGALKVWPRDEWIAAVRDRPSPASQGLARDDAIVRVDRTGPTTAVAVVRCQIPPRFFTDQLNLLKVEGRWQVVQKVFAVRVEAA